MIHEQLSTTVLIHHSDSEILLKFLCNDEILYIGTINQLSNHYDLEIYAYERTCAVRDAGPVHKIDWS